MRFKYLILLIMAALGAVPGWSREAVDFFMDMPNKHLPLLDRGARLDMVDYFNAGLETATKTGLGGKARILSKHPRRMLVEVSRDATVEIAVVKAGNDTLIALIETVKTPVPDSYITLMEKDFSNPRVVEMPGASMFAMPDRAKAVAKSTDPLMMFVTASFDPDNNAFIFTNNTAQYYPESEQPEIVGLLRQQIHVVLKGDRFIELKR